MKTMSVYGLLGKIYNCNDDLPKRILFRYRIYELDDYNHYMYMYEETDLFDETLNCELDDFLHEQVGIIENDETEKKKIPEKLDVDEEEKGKFIIWNTEFEQCTALEMKIIKRQDYIIRKINELIDYLESKGE